MVMVVIIMEEEALTQDTAMEALIMEVSTMEAFSETLEAF